MRVEYTVDGMNKMYKVVNEKVIMNYDASKVNVCLVDEEFAEELVLD